MTYNMRQHKLIQPCRFIPFVSCELKYELQNICLTLLQDKLVLFIIYQYQVNVDQFKRERVGMHSKFIQKIQKTNQLFLLYSQGSEIFFLLVVQRNQFQMVVNKSTQHDKNTQNMSYSVISSRIIQCILYPSVKIHRKPFSSVSGISTYAVYLLSINLNYVGF